MDTNKNNNQPKMPKFNMNWIYIFVIISLVLIFFSSSSHGFGNSSVSIDKDYTSFINYVNKGYASKVEINKDESTLKMYVKPEHQREVFGQGNLGSDPYVKVDIGSTDNLETFLNTAVQQKKISGFSYKNNDSSLLTNILINVLPWVLIILVWFWLMRGMSGGGRGGGIFSVGKSKAKLYEKS